MARSRESELYTTTPALAGDFKVLNVKKAYREKLGVVSEPEEEHAHEGEVGPDDDPGGEDLVEPPRVGDGGRLDPVLGNGHDGAVVQDGDDEHHERREVELPYQGDEQEPEHDTDRDGDRVDCVVLHPLEDGPAGEHRTDYHAKPGLGEDDVGGASRRICGIRHRNPDIGPLQGRGIVDTVSRHSANVLSVLKSLHNLVLVLCARPGIPHQSYGQYPDRLWNV